MLPVFPGEIAGASLKRLRVFGLSVTFVLRFPRRNRRGLIEAFNWAPIVKWFATGFPRRNRRGLIEAC